MRNKFLQIFFGFVMAFTLSFNLGIRQVLHTFEHHEDTIHSCAVHSDSDHADQYIDKQHHHCDYLTDLLPQFTPAFLSYDFETVPERTFQEFLFASYSIHPKDAFYSFQLRGPPAIV